MAPAAALRLLHERQRPDPTPPQDVPPAVSDHLV